MANPVFDPERALGLKVTKMDRQELCEFVSALCRKVVAEVGSRGRRGGIYPSNISVDDNGGFRSEVRSCCFEQPRGRRRQPSGLSP